MVTIISMIVLLFVEGTFLNYPFTTPFTGYALARIFSNNNLII
jgi:Ni,Fe-hydrogenase I cytochrome b subunit